jgi:hypothetical protein
MPNPYKALFPIGSIVRVKNRADLERFAMEWRQHDPLTAEQIEFADATSSVKGLGYYHGGDPLYKLKGVPGVWHEECLQSP